MAIQTFTTAAGPTAATSLLTRSYIECVRERPSRRPASTGMGNCCHRYASRKMGCVLMGESTLEYRLMLSLEYDRDVTEYFDQPEPLAVRIVRRDGRLTPVRYTPDALALLSGQSILYEAKYVKDCELLCRKRPNDWSYDGSSYHFEPAERAARSIGASHIVVTETDLPAVLADNLECLLKSRHPDAVSGDHKLSACLGLLRDMGECTIASLVRELSLKTIEPLLRWIDAGEVSADLRAGRISCPEEFLVSSRCYRLNRTASTGEDNSVSLAAVPRDEDLREAGRRLRIVQGELIDPSASTRTIRRWREQYERGGKDILSLVPNIRQRGNRTPRITVVHEQLIERVIREEVMKPDAVNFTFAYASYLRAHEDAGASGVKYGMAGEDPVSFPTFLRRVAKQDRVEMAALRSGSRAANAARPPREPATRSLASQRPFHRVHIDHYICDLFVVVMESGGRRHTERPWLTCAVDEFSGAVVAMSLSFANPSRWACASILRDCADRHGRLPEVIVVDNGKEFESVYFECCLGRLGITKQSRPPGDPRFGASVERIFGTLRSELLAALPGNTNNSQRGRCSTTACKGEALAVMTIEQAYAAIETYFFRQFNTHARGEYSSSPEVMQRQGLEAMPSCGVSVVVDAAFYIATAIDAKKPILVDASRGLKHKGRWYSSPQLRPALHRQRLEVREEPHDSGRIYALVGHRWVTCYTRRASGHDVPIPPPHMKLTSIIDLQTPSAKAAARRRRMTDRARLIDGLKSDATNPQNATTVPQEVPVVREQTKRNCEVITRGSIAPFPMRAP